ncbi:MAG: hypothetical protein Fur002_20730 [Anaerolineales bacterium]
MLYFNSMKTLEVQVEQIYLDGSAQFICSPELIPAPGQYLLAALRSDQPAALILFPRESTPEGFRSAPIEHFDAPPGARLLARGPLGHGFSLPLAARKVALLAFDDCSARLRGLIPLAFRQNAEVVLLASRAEEDLPEAVEVQPLQALREILQWADFLAIDVARERLRERLPELKTALGESKPLMAQVLVRAPMPCGGAAECGVCALTSAYHWKMICKDGPVFDLQKALT